MLLGDNNSWVGFVRMTDNVRYVEVDKDVIRVSCDECLSHFSVILHQIYFARSYEETIAK